MNTNKRTPKLRFKGFTDDWEQRKLSDILKVNSGKDYKYLDQGTIPVYGTGGYMLSVNESLSNIDAIGIGRKGTIDKPQYLKAPFWTVDTLFYLTALDKHSILFLYYLMQLIPWKKFDESTGVPSLSKTTIENINGYVPSKPKEEELISALFSQLDKSITLHQRKLDNLKLKKKALLQKLFPKNGERYPELRFPGFTDAWEQRKLESLFTKYEDKVNIPDSGYWRLGLRSHCKGTFHTYVDAGHELETTEMYRVKAGNFILNITFAWERALAVTDDEDQDKLVSHRFPQFKPNSDLVIDFFKHTLMDKRLKHHLELSSPGGAGRNKVLKVSDMLKYELLVPSIQEQNIISSFLNNIDHIITLHQHKLDRLISIKKGLLQQLFV